MAKHQIPYSKSVIEFTLPARMEVTTAVSYPALRQSDISSAIDDALAQPVAVPPLRELARPRDRGCIVFTDVTRASPDHLLVPALLKELKKAGAPDEKITLLCGVGMHRASTQAEKVAKLGRDIANRYCVIDNEPQNPATLVELGFTQDGAPDVQFILDDARRNGYPPGQQRAFVMAKVPEQTQVIIVGSECPDLVAACKRIPAATMDEALGIAAKELGEACRALIVPHAMLTLPVVDEGAGV